MLVQPPLEVLRAANISLTWMADTSNQVDVLHAKLLATPALLRTRLRRATLLRFLFDQSPPKRRSNSIVWAEPSEAPLELIRLGGALRSASPVGLGAKEGRSGGI